MEETPAGTQDHIYTQTHTHFQSLKIHCHTHTHAIAFFQAICGMTMSLGVQAKHPLLW